MSYLYYYIWLEALLMSATADLSETEVRAFLINDSNFQKMLNEGLSSRDDHLVELSIWNVINLSNYGEQNMVLDSTITLMKVDELLTKKEW